MTKTLLTLATAATVAFAPLAPSTSFAAEAGAAYGGTIGALSLETQGLATNADQVRGQGGFATAGAVRWAVSPAAAAKPRAASF